MLAERILFSLVVVGCPLAVACDDDDDDDDDDGALDRAVCNPTSGNFSLDIDNDYFPLPVGHQLVLEGDDEGTLVRVEITVLDATEVVAGITTRVVEEAEFEDDEVVEISRNFYVQAEDGTVCYYGEEVDDYEDGEIVGHGGAWRAGKGGALPGIIMPGDPETGMEFAQERAPGVAEDRSAVMGTDGEVSVPAGDFDDVLHLVDWNPLEDQTMADGEVKLYAEDVGLIVDDVVSLVSYTENDD